MTAQERIEAALVAREKATPGPWGIGNGRRTDLYQGWNAILANNEDGDRFVLATVNHNFEELAKYNGPLIAAAPDLVDEVIRLRAWQQEALPYLRIALQKLKPNPLDFIHFDESIADLDRLIAEAQED